MVSNDTVCKVIGVCVLVVTVIAVPLLLTENAGAIAALTALATVSFTHLLPL